MKPETYNKLTEEFPELFAKLEYGCECGDGWYQIIRAFCIAVKSTAFNIREDATLDIPKVELTCVKQKFGTIRIYYSLSYDDKWTKLYNTDINQYLKNIDKAEQFIFGCSQMAHCISLITCENTGKPGKMHVRGGWVKVLCPEEAAANNYTVWEQK
jgi:hypothetical protein